MSKAKQFQAEMDAQEFSELMTKLLEKHPRLGVELPTEEIPVVIANLQLALRHPGNSGLSAKITRRFVDFLIATMEQLMPGIGKYLNKGFDPSQDV